VNGNGAQTLTHSRLSCFRACPRRHYLRYQLGLCTEQTTFAMRVGSGFHHALDTIAKGIDDLDAAMQAAIADPYDLALVAAMVNGYQQHWSEYGLQHVASELAFDLPLRNPETGRPTPTWRLAGVIDRIVQLPDGRLAIKESKTTSRDVSPGADYWIAVRMDQQISIYVMAARELGYEIDTILYDVVRRPMMRPYKATPGDKRKYRSDGELYLNQHDVDETPEEFACRVGADIAKRPEHYFTRIEIARLDQDLDECAAGVWQQQLAIRTAQKAGHWYRNPNACFSPYPCSYLPICMNNDLETNTPNGFVRVADVNPEIAASGASPTCHVQG